MSFVHTRAAMAAITAFVLIIIGSFSAIAPSFAAPDAKASYRFELAGAPEKSTGGKRIVSVRLVHVSDGKPVSGAVIFQTRADMGPSGMQMMTAPVKTLPETTPGFYRFEIEPGMAGSWALTLAAKVQGETETAQGTVTVNLAM